MYLVVFYSYFVVNQTKIYRLSRWFILTLHWFEFANLTVFDVSFRTMKWQCFDLESFSDNYNVLISILSGWWFFFIWTFSDNENVSIWIFSDKEFFLFNFSILFLASTLLAPLPDLLCWAFTPYGLLV